MCCKSCSQSWSESGSNVYKIEEYQRTYQLQNYPCCILICHMIFRGILWTLCGSLYNYAFQTSTFDISIINPEISTLIMSINKTMVVNDFKDAFPDNLEIMMDHHDGIEVYYNHKQQDLPYCLPAPKFVEILWMPFYGESQTVGNINQSGILDFDYNAPIDSGDDHDNDKNSKAQFSLVDIFTSIGVELNKNCIFRFDNTDYQQWRQFESMGYKQSDIPYLICSTNTLMNGAYMVMTDNCVFYQIHDSPYSCIVNDKLCDKKHSKMYTKSDWIDFIDSDSFMKGLEFFEYWIYFMIACIWFVFMIGLSFVFSFHLAYLSIYSLISSIAVWILMFIVWIYVKMFGANANNAPKPTFEQLWKINLVLSCVQFDVTMLFIDPATLYQKIGMLIVRVVIVLVILSKLRINMNNNGAIASN